MWIRKNVTSGARKTHTSSKRSQCIHKVLLFGADFALAASLPHLYSKIKRAAGTANGEPIGSSNKVKQRRTLRVIQRMLQSIFGNRIISKKADVNCPPRSCDLTPLACFLCGAMKDKCYVNILKTIQVRKTEIRAAIAEIMPETIESVLKNCVERMGGHLTENVIN